MSAVALKFFAAWAKEKEKEKINTLEADLKSRDRENSVLKEARRHSIRIAEHVHAVVDEKLHRLAEALSKPDFSAERYFLALDSGEQLQFIIIMIREFFVSELDPGRKLRAGVYMESPPGSNLLEPLYSWDGKTRECFSQQGSKYMRLNDAEGSKSMIAQAFHTDESLLVVSSCESEERKGLFTYFRPEQKKVPKEYSDIQAPMG